MKVLDKILSAIFYIAYIIFWILCLIVLGFSLVTVIRFRQYEQNDLFDILRDNTPFLLLSMILVFILLIAIQGWSDWRKTARENSGAKSTIPLHKNIPKNIPFPWPMVLVSTGFSLFIVLVIHGIATNDALQLDEIMQQFAREDYSTLYPGGYLFVYPFQIFYVWIGELIQTLCGPSNYLIYQFLNIVSIVLNLYFLYQITWELFEDRNICRVMQALAIGCVFYFVYATFVYSDLWSFAAQTAAFYLQILYMKRDKIRYEIGAGICIAFACLLKSNSYIALIAMIIVLIADGIRKEAGLKNNSNSNEDKKNEGINNINGDRADREKSKNTYRGKSSAGCFARRRGATICLGLALALMLFLMTRCASLIVSGTSARIAGLDSFPEGVPPMNYIAMGMQETEGKYGWYNGTNVALYRDAGWDRDASITAAKDSIQESIASFRNSGRYFVKFYMMKFLSQWGDPTCVSMRELEETERHVEPVYPVASSLIFGAGSAVLQWVMNVIHSIIWLGAVVFGLALLRKKKLRRNSGVILLVVFVFGGMLFHELWEASGRYTMRYYLTLLPLAAWGVNDIVQRVIAVGTRRKQLGTMHKGL